MKPEPRNVLPCPTILSPVKKSAVAANELPIVTRNDFIISGNPLGNTMPPIMPEIVINIMGLTNKERNVFKTSMT